MLRALFLPALLVSASPAIDAPLPVMGRWTTAGGKALVEIAACGPSLRGRIARILVTRPGGPALDANNPDPVLRTRRLEGIALLSGFQPAGDRWKGRICDHESGRAYRAELARAGTVLKVKGCWDPFCRTQDWTAAR